jgi:predicted PurR-regulated permease PerM
MLNATPLEHTHSLPKGLLKAGITSLAVGIVFLGYLLLIGIPKTQARNLFNQAESANKNGDIQKAKELLQQAYLVWPEGYIASELENYSAK